MRPISFTNPCLYKIRWYWKTEWFFNPFDVCKTVGNHCGSGEAKGIKEVFIHLRLEFPNYPKWILLCIWVQLISLEMSDDEPIAAFHNCVVCHCDIITVSDFVSIFNQILSSGWVSSTPPQRAGSHDPLTGVLAGAGGSVTSVLIIQLCSLLKFQIPN